MKLFWHGIKPNCKTGYGVQSKLFIPKLRAAHDVILHPMIDQYETQVDSTGLIHLGTGPASKGYGNAFFDMHVANHAPDAVISMNDAYACDPDKFARVPWFPFVMVDCAPLLGKLAKALKSAKKCIAITRWGQRVLKDSGFDSWYCPLAYSSADFYVEPDRAACRANLGTMLGREIKPSTAVVMMNSANHSSPSRKDFYTAFKAWKLFHDARPDSLLYMHTERTGTVCGGEDLDAQMSLCGVDPASVAFVPQYPYATGIIGSDVLRMAYNAADVFLNTSHGEGFGVPMIEAQACGCSVVAPLFGGNEEIVRYGNLAMVTLFSHVSGSEQCTAEAADVAKCLEFELIWNIEHERAAISNAVAEYEINNVNANNLQPMLKEMESML